MFVSWTKLNLWNAKTNKILKDLTKADDTQGNFFLSKVVWALSNWEWVSHFYLDTLDRSWAMCLTWMSFDDNIAQKVAQCIISLMSKIKYKCIK